MKFSSRVLISPQFLDFNANIEEIRGEFHILIAFIYGEYLFFLVLS